MTRRLGRSSIAALGIVLAAVLSPAAAPAHAADSDPIVLEDRESSHASIEDGTVVEPAPTEMPEDVAGIWGTLAPEEEVDAYEFTSPWDGEVEVTLELDSDVWTGEEPPSLTLLNEEGEPIAQGEPVDGEAEFDWGLLESVTPEERASVTLDAGETYTLAVEPGTPTGATLDYVIQIEPPSEPPADPIADVVVGAPDLFRLWSGAYAQHAPEGLHIAIMVATIGVLVGMAISIGRALVRSLRSPDVKRVAESRQPFLSVDRAAPPVRTAVDVRAWDASRTAASGSPRASESTVRELPAQTSATSRPEHPSVETPTPEPWPDAPVGPPPEPEHRSSPPAEPPAVVVTPAAARAAAQPGPSLGERATSWVSRLQGVGSQPAAEPEPAQSVSVDDRLGAYLVDSGDARRDDAGDSQPDSPSAETGGR